LACVTEINVLGVKYLDWNQPLCGLHRGTGEVSSNTCAPILIGAPLPSSNFVDPAGSNTAFMPHLSQWCSEGGWLGCVSSTKWWPLNSGIMRNRRWHVYLVSSNAKTRGNHGPHDI
jgi:hypothetical protein